MATIASTPGQLGTIETNIPARLDRLPWSRWHWRILIGLGTVWILDGLEVTIVGSIAGAISAKGSGINISSADIAGWAASMYVAGACVGALLFGRLTDMFGRKRLFMVTLGVYLAATIATAFAWTPLFFLACRFVTGMGIGGEYSAINSAIDELIPCKHRGRIDILINGTYWAGAAAGALLSVAALHIFSPLVNWRVCFGLGFTLGLAILIVRRHVPESPRWLFIHGRVQEAEEVTRDIERQVAESTDAPLHEPDDTITIRQRRSIPLWEIAAAIVRGYPRRTVLGLSLFIGQAFLYNAILFGYATLLSTFFHVSTGDAPYYLVAFALGNLLGPLVLGRLFDTVGRKPMIAGTYILSGALLLVTGFMFDQHQLSAGTLTLSWTVVFFFASAGVSAAYLTVSEIFPMETRALAIALFYAVGTGIGGIIGPQLFGRLIPTGKTSDVFVA
ncbi:MAG: MFS transporter, partial [Solirubrobacterales bacterium]|nr:MFS transporter [Solirubrobacterales bacterium]